MFPDGGRYQGDWQQLGENGVKTRHGQGVWTCGPEEYSGSWVTDAMSGEGTYKFASGACYRGSFVNNQFEGKGEYIFADSATYLGEWKGGKMHGEGVYTDKDKVSWSGSFFNGLYDSGRSYISLRPGNGLV